MTKKPAPLPPSPPKAPSAPPSAEGFSFGPPAPIGQRTIIYGQGGIGKTSLAALAPDPKAIFDFDESFNVLDSSRTDIVRGITSIRDYKAALDSDMFDAVKVIVSDSASAIQDLVERHVIDTVPHEKGAVIQRLTDYGFGKQNDHMYAEWQSIIALWDKHIRAGRHIILIAHEEKAVDEDPTLESSGQRWQPRILSPSGRGGSDSSNSVRNRLIAWADHLLYVKMEVTEKKKKGAFKPTRESSGSRMIYRDQNVAYAAKSRSLDEDILYEQGSDELWQKMFGGK